jgi:PhnB protein
MASHSISRPPASYSIAPWLSVRNGARAVEFYKAAFGAVESHRLEDPTGAVVAKLSVNGAVFWVSGESPENVNSGPEIVGGGTVRMVLIVPDPDAAFARALNAGASEIFPVGEEHGLASRTRSGSFRSSLGNRPRNYRLTSSSRCRVWPAFRCHSFGDF